MNTEPIGMRRVAASSAILLAENVARLAVTAAVSFWIARRLGPGLFGILNFASALMAICLGVASFGLDVPATLRLARAGRETAGPLLGVVLALRLAASVAAFALMVIVAIVVKHDDSTALAVSCIVAVAILGYAPGVFDIWFKAEVHAGPPASMRLLTTLLSSAVKVACLSLGFGLMALAWTIVLEAALSSALLALAWRRHSGGLVAPASTSDRGLVKALTLESWPFWISTVAVLLTMKLDVVLLAGLASNVEAGIYSLAQKLSEVLYIVPVVLIDSVFPAMARTFGGRDPDQGQLMFDVAFVAALLAAGLGVLCAGPLILMTFGERYAPAVSIFQVHAWTCLPVALTTARHRWLGMAGLQRHAPWLAVSGAVISVALNLLTIPRFGAWGAAGSALVSYSLSGVVTSLLVRDLRPIGRMQFRSLWPWRRLFKAAWPARRRLPA